MKNPFLKYVMKEKKEDIFHSSVHGRAQSGAVMGTASTESFSQRMKIDKNRQMVHKYDESLVAEKRFNGGAKAKQYVPPEKKESFGVRPVNAQRSGGASNGAAKMPSPPIYKNRLGK